MGYFLQPIYVQKLKTRIYFYDELVRKMETEFKERVRAKREAIQRMRLKVKELALVEAWLICDRCSTDIAPVRTLDFISSDLHYAKCVFGTLNRVELAEAQSHQYAADKDFVELYLEDYENLKAAIKVGAPKSSMETSRDFAFAKCRNEHILGVVVDRKYYITAVSQVRIMFPNSHYEEWHSRFWQPGYPEVVALQKKCLATRQLNAKPSRFSCASVKGAPVPPVTCELCN